MFDNEVLTNDNFVFYAIKNYRNNQCTGYSEFEEDLKRVKYIKKLLTRYQTHGELKERLILNHLVILNNVFGPCALIRILTLKMQSQLKFLKPFLILLSIMPDVIINVGSKDSIIYSDEIDMDQKIVEALRKL